MSPCSSDLRPADALQKRFAFRFDVDTHRCVRAGVPALSALGAELGVPFTFFVNMGRAVVRRRALRVAGSSGDVQEAAKLSARRKLGWSDYLRAAVLNPRVGAGSVEVIRAAHRAGHEIGLHGGLNHAHWQAEADRWSRERLGAEIDAVLPRLVEAMDGTPPMGFASPGWRTSPDLPEVLLARGFAYVADRHGADACRDGATSAGVEGLPDVCTALTGEPGGVAYLEHLRALGFDDTAIVARFRDDLTRAGPEAVAYDHPYFAGVSELAMVRRLVEVAREEGYEVVSVAQMLEAAET